MNNPYEILKVNQDANKGEIMKAQILAMKEKKYSLQEIAVAVRQLLDPAKRLAADYMFPTKIKSKRIQKIAVEIPVEKIDLNDIDENTFDSLK
ncbi:MAG: molecular chaperone DnaJ [Bacteroidetes bacterium]|nr:molecular chaperone DnaJ [Bacteroidota bacterium]